MRSEFIKSKVINLVLMELGGESFWFEGSEGFDTLMSKLDLSHTATKEILDHFNARYNKFFVKRARCLYKYQQVYQFLLLIHYIILNLPLCFLSYLKCRVEMEEDYQKTYTKLMKNEISKSEIG